MGEFEKSMLLLKTLFLSTSQRNRYRYCKDPKKRRKVIMNAIGGTVLHLLLLSYCILMCIGYGTMGIIGAAPGLCAMLISILAFVLTLFQTNGYLFAFREYDLLLSLPFEARTVAGSKFLYMYGKSLPWYLNISLSMMAGYGFFARPGIITYPLWVVLTFFLPVIPMLGAAFVGFLIAKASAGFRNKGIIQTILTFAVVLFSFFLRFIVEKIFREEQVDVVFEKTSEMTGKALRVYLPGEWFVNGVSEGRISDALLLVGVSILLFSVVFWIVGRSYQSIHSALASHAAAKKYRMGLQRQHPPVWAVAMKEWRRMKGSAIYLTNAGIGMVLAPLVSLIVLLLGFDKIITLFTQGALVDGSLLRPAIPFFVYFFIGMVATTVCSPSLEGKNYWIVQSLPIPKKTLYHGKMLFHMLLSVPPMAFSTLCLCIAARTPFLETILYIILGLVLCAFSTAWGCVLGIRYRRLDWENEVEVVKQGAAVTLYLLPNMFLVMALIILVVFIGMRLDHRLLALLLIGIVSLLAFVSYKRAIVLAQREF